MQQSSKATSKVNIKIKQGYLTLNLYLPVKWLLVFLVAILIYFLPDIWETIQIAISVVP